MLLVITLDTAGVCSTTFIPAFSLTRFIIRTDTFLLPADSDIWSVLIPFSFRILHVSTTYQFLCVICKDTHFPLAYFLSQHVTSRRA